PARTSQEGPRGIPRENGPGQAGPAGGALARARIGTGSGIGRRIENPAQTGSRMTHAAPVGRDKPARWQAPPAVLAGAFLFNLGQGVLRPTLPLYLRSIFTANYRMVTLIPVVFGGGKWVASLPTGSPLHRGRGRHRRV